MPRPATITLVNAHSALLTLAQGSGAAFFFVFLLRAGLSIPAALLVQCGILLGRLLVRPVLLPIAKLFGLKPMLIAGAVMLSAQYPILASVDGVGWPLLALGLATGLAEIVYWLTYNAYFAHAGDVDGRGGQIGTREALMTSVGVIAPLLGAWGFTHEGPRWTFWVIALVQACSALPLLGIPNVAIKPSAPGAYAAAREGFWLGAFKGWFDAGFAFLWQMALYRSLGDSLGAYGGAMALAGLAGAAGALWMGRRVDAGHGGRLAALAFGLAGIAVALRAASLGLPWLAVGAAAFSALVLPLMIPPFDAAVYGLAKASPCVFRFGLAAEAGWDIGCLAGCLASAALIASGAAPGAALLLGLPGLAFGAGLLKRHYAGEVVAA